MKKSILLLVSVCLLFGIFYALNTKNYVPEVISEKKTAELIRYIEDIYKINPHDFNMLSLTRYNDSLYLSVRERLLDQGLHLVLYIPEKNCQDCVVKVIEKFKSFPDFMQDRIFLMTAFPRERDVRMWLSSHKYQYPVYNSLSFGTGSNVTRKRLTLFLVNGTGIPSNFFQIERIFPDISDNYYNFVIAEFEKEMVGLEEDEELSDDEKPEIRVSNKHDFGELNMKDKVFTVFEFENLSEAPLVITDVRTNCGCTVPEWDKKPIGKGGKLKVKVEFVAEQTGIFTKRITVYTNAKGSPHSLTITGNVRNN